MQISKNVGRELEPAICDGPVARPHDEAAPGAAVRLAFRTTAGQGGPNPGSAL
ncbi:hypothetical protein M1P56_35940 (plasmid) [Streptomyces sp. HU2014]|uniref:hypothetical protein n=1 Tax=Streptomyces sp. HU2014 TaxID=2939414 RepID=UPI00200D7F58|nr:hypothetical protein [Streptomyces sp. HU2014]UQI49796.1 hypothetical protein M1P56_35940 [Streptomyces sp. HU2014]